MQRQNLRSVNNTKSPLSFKNAIKDIHTPKGRYVIYAILTMSIVAPILQKMIGLVASDNIALYITLGIMVIGLFCVAFKMDKISEVIKGLIVLLRDGDGLEIMVSIPFGSMENTNYWYIWRI